MFLNSGVCRQGAGPFLADFFGDDVHHATQGIGAIQGGHRAAHHFDALDSIDGDPVEIEIVMAEDGVAGVDALTVHQNQGVAAVQPTDADPFTVIPFIGELHAWHVL
ncbi:hypothetical protein D3C76_1244160 [compost metagenome]